MRVKDFPSADFTSGSVGHTNLPRWKCMSTAFSINSYGSWASRLHIGLWDWQRVGESIERSSTLCKYQGKNVGRQPIQSYFSFLVLLLCYIKWSLDVQNQENIACRDIWSKNVSKTIYTHTQQSVSANTHMWICNTHTFSADPVFLGTCSSSCGEAICTVCCSVRARVHYTDSTSLWGTESKATHHFHFTQWA